MSTAAKPLIVPPLPNIEPASPKFLLSRGFCGGGPKESLAYGLVMNFIRIADIAVYEYELGRDAVATFWTTRDIVRFDEITRATGHFEFCLTSIKRCLDFFDQLKGSKKVPAKLKESLDKQRAVFSKANGTKVADIRNSIEHLVGDIIGGMDDGQSLCLKPEPDGLVLGDHEIPYKDLVSWLVALNDNAHSLAEFKEESEEA